MKWRCKNNVEMWKSSLVVMNLQRIVTLICSSFLLYSEFQLIVYLIVLLHSHSSLSVIPGCSCFQRWTYRCWELMDSFREFKGSRLNKIISNPSPIFFLSFIDQQQNRTPDYYFFFTHVLDKTELFLSCQLSFTLPPLLHLTQSEPDRRFSWHLWWTSCVGRQ